MKKYFVFSDVHSFYDELMSSLTKTGFDINNKDHIVISCGDLFDRGPQSRECLDFIVNMINQDRAICVKGNHEDMMEEIFVKRHFSHNDFHNGTDKTFDQLCRDESPDLTAIQIIDDVQHNEKLNLYLSNCVDYYELEDNVFVHGWIPVHISCGMFVDRMYPIENWKNGDWYNARWLNGMQCWHEDIKLKNKTIYCGHWHSSWGHCYLHNDGDEFVERIGTRWIDEKTGKLMPYARHDSFKDDGIVALDACTVESRMVNVEVIEVN